MRFITLNSNSKVTGVRFGDSIVEGEIKSDIGLLGQIMQSDGIFKDDSTTTSYPNEPTNSEIAQMLSDLQADLIIAEVI